MKKKDLLSARDTFHLEIPADENNLSEVRDFIADICLRAGFSRREMNNTKLAVDEACTNIIKHAYRDRGGDIRIDVEAAPGTVTINIFDRGEPFEWGKVKEPDLNLYVEIGKKGGLGIFLMSRLMDNLSYAPSPNGNRLSMTKSVAGAAVVGKAPLFVSIKPRWFSTLRFKFGLRAGLGLLGLIVFLWAILFYRQTAEHRSQVVQVWLQRKTIAENLGVASASALTEGDYSVEGARLNEGFAKQIKKYPEIRYIRIVSSGGKIAASSDMDELLGQYAIPGELAKLEPGGASRTIEDRAGAVIRELHQPIYLPGADRTRAEPIGRVVLGVSEEAVMGEIHDPRPLMTLLLGGVFIAGLALIYLLISIFVKPIQALTDGVRAIGEGSLTDEIKIEGPEEIGEIARAFNEITAKFKEAQKNVVEQERLQKEMQVAQEIQHSLLPKRQPRISGYDIASLYNAAKEVGGDYYDFVAVDEDTIGVVVADVSGKGVPGSLVMTMIRTALRMEARGNLSAAEVMARMNDFVTEDMKKGMFVTIFYAILDSKNRIISYASAGHNPMILYRAETDETYFLNPRGFPVGISLPDDTLFRRSIDVEKIKLKKDDMLVIYTDGVTEAMNADRDQYGEERLIKLIKECGRLAPQEFIDRLRTDVKDFTGDQPQNDDITVVAIKEKLMADEVLYGIRKKLLDLVDVEGLSVAEACSRMKVSPSTYYRYKKRLVDLGDRGLQDKALRSDYELKRVSLEQRKELLEIITSNPRIGAKKIAEVFNEGKEEQDQLTYRIVYDELKRIRLNTYELRLEYLRRNRIVTEDEFRDLMAAARAIPHPPHPVKQEAAEAEEAGAEPAKKPPRHRPPRPKRLAEAALTVPAAEEGTSAVEVESEEFGGGVVALHVRGHLDSSSAGELEGMLESIYEYGYRKIVVDLKDVTYISSGGWGIFTGRVKLLREGDGDVVLVGMSPEVYDIYELLGFQEIIMQFREMDDALAYIALDSEERERRLAEISSSRAAATAPTAAAADAAAAEEGGEAPYTPLKIEAGTVGDKGEITILSLNGVVDTVSSVRLRSVLDGFVDRGTVNLVVDMSRVEYVSSSGWGVFTSRIEDIRRRGGDIKIFGMDPEVDQIFHLLDFNVIMRSFSILTEAIDDFARPAPARSEVRPDGSFEVLGGARRAAARDRAAPPDSGELPPSTRVASSGKLAPPGPRPGRPAAPEAGDRRLDIGLSKMEADGPAVIVMRVTGAVDSSNAEELERHLERCAAAQPQQIVIDLSGLVYMSSSGWGVVVKTMQRLRETNTRLTLAAMSQAIFKIYRDLGFEPFIPYFVSVEAALGAGEAGAAEVPLEAGGASQTPEEAPPAPEESAPASEEPPAQDGLIPGIVKADIAPLAPLVPAREKKKVIRIDFHQGADAREDKDSRIKKLGWEEYGRKLHNRDRDSKRRRK